MGRLEGCVWASSRVGIERGNRKMRIVLFCEFRSWKRNGQRVRFLQKTYKDVCLGQYAHFRISSPRGETGETFDIPGQTLCALLWAIRVLKAFMLTRLDPLWAGLRARRSNSTRHNKSEFSCTSSHTRGGWRAHELSTRDVRTLHYYSYRIQMGNREEELESFWKI